MPIIHELILNCSSFCPSFLSYPFSSLLVLLIPSPLHAIEFHFLDNGLRPSIVQLYLSGPLSKHLVVYTSSRLFSFSVLAIFCVQRYSSNCNPSISKTLFFFQS